MRSRRSIGWTWLGVLASLAWLSPANATDDPIPLAIGAQIPEMVGHRDHLGRPFESSAWKGKKSIAVLFLGVECKIVDGHCRDLVKLQSQFSDRFQLVGVDSNCQDSLQDIERYAKQHDLNFPLIRDPGSRIADDFGAERTPQVFLFDSQGVLRYQGAISDGWSYGQQKGTTPREYLRDALESVLQQAQPSVETTEVEGCIIGRKRNPQADAEVTYSNQIARLIQNRCIDCHREGQIGPFAMNQYDEVAGWAEMILEVTQDRRMPPWHAEPNPQHDWANDARLSDEELQLIKSWVQAGAPEGNPADLPEPKVFSDEWQIGTPDAVFTMEESFAVPATGVLDYEYIAIKTNFDEDKWIQAAECRPGAPEVVHHIIVGIDRRSKQSARRFQIPSEWITATAPGAPPLQLRDGYAKLLPKGATLVLQMHYTPNGVAQKDRSSVAFKFVDPEKVVRSVGTVEIINRDFRKGRKSIAPNSITNIKAEHVLTRDTYLLSLFPHMHLRGAAFRYDAYLPGESEPMTLLNVPRYDFNWQNAYEFSQPKLMPAGTRIVCRAKFDNTSENYANPAPHETVYSGEQTDDEMMIGYFNMALKDQDLRRQSKRKKPNGE